MEDGWAERRLFWHWASQKADVVLSLQRGRQSAITKMGKSLERAPGWFGPMRRRWCSGGAVVTDGARGDGWDEGMRMHHGEGLGCWQSMDDGLGVIARLGRSSRFGHICKAALCAVQTLFPPKMTL